MDDERREAEELRAPSPVDERASWLRHPRDLAVLYQWLLAELGLARQVTQVSGSDEQVEQAERVFRQLRGMLAQQGKLTSEDVRTVLEVVQQGGERVIEEANAVGDVGRSVRPRTDGQARYVRAMRDSDLAIP